MTKYNSKIHVILLFLFLNLFEYGLCKSSAFLKLIKEYSKTKAIGSAYVMPPEVVTVMASRQMRKHHFMWHATRNNWNRIDDATKQTLTDMGWFVERPARNANGTNIFDNFSGEDFLYMHHRMILTVNDILSKGNYAYGKKVKGWIDIPGPNDPDFPVPPYNGNNPRTILIKSDDYYTHLSQLNNMFKDPNFLRNISLGELGSRLEVEIHNDLHGRFSEQNFNPRPAPTPFYNADSISTDWDRITYNQLGDTYSSHVNDYFWCLHGWIDARIEDWRQANNLCEINWIGTWEGIMDEMEGMDKDTEVSIDHEMPEMHMGGSSNHVMTEMKMGSVVIPIIHPVVRPNSVNVIKNGGSSNNKMTGMNMRNVVIPAVKPVVRLNAVNVVIQKDRILPDVSPKNIPIDAPDHLERNSQDNRSRRNSENKWSNRSVRNSRINSSDN